MSDKRSKSDIFCANFTLPFFILTILTGFAYPAITGRVKEESTQRTVSVDKLSTTIANANEKHNKDIAELYKDSNRKYEKIMDDITAIKSSVSRLEGKVL